MNSFFGLIFPFICLLSDEANALPVNKYHNHEKYDSDYQIVKLQIQWMRVIMGMSIPCLLILSLKTRSWPIKKYCITSVFVLSLLQLLYDFY